MRAIADPENHPEYPTVSKFMLALAIGLLGIGFAHIYLGDWLQAVTNVMFAVALITSEYRVRSSWSIGYMYGQENQPRWLDTGEKQK